MSICITAWRVLESARPSEQRPIFPAKAPPFYVPVRLEIPWPAIERYARFEGLSREATQLLVDVIAYLDRERAVKIDHQLKRSAR